jgi:hypothetical protein
MGIIRAPQTIKDADLPASIARDIEITAAIAVDKATAVSIVQQSVSSPAQIAINANTWFDLGVLNNVNPGDSESLFAVSVLVQYITSGQTYSYWQHSGACLISPVWWKAGGAQLVKYVDMEVHNGTDYTLSFRLAMTQANRMVQLYFPVALTARFVRSTFVRLRP